MMGDKKENVCCGIIEQLAEKFDRPFEQPMCFEEGKTFMEEWSLRLMKLTPGGNISSASGMNSTILINYCPFCGKELREKAEEQP